MTTICSPARRPLALAAATLLLVLVSGCTTSTVNQAEPAPSDSATASASEPSADVPARVGRTARSERVRFIPQQVTLPGGAHATVEPASTVDGELKVPENVQHVGWWDGSAYVGDPFGSTVLAGHVDSASDGVGYFARLLRVKVGEEITVRSGSHRLTYRITSVQSVAKQALSADSRAFDQTGDPRLVLITCTGNYRPDRGGYDSNLVVIAKPLGMAR